MMMLPLHADTRAFAIDWFLENMAQGRATPAEANDILSQLRMLGDVANLERLSRLLADRRRP